MVNISKTIIYYHKQNNNFLKNVIVHIFNVWSHSILDKHWFYYFLESPVHLQVAMTIWCFDKNFKGYGAIIIYPLIIEIALQSHSLHSYCFQDLLLFKVLLPCKERTSEGLTESVWSIQPKLFTTRVCTEKVCQPWSMLLVGLLCTLKYFHLAGYVIWKNQMIFGKIIRNCQEIHI